MSAVENPVPRRALVVARRAYDVELHAKHPVRQSTLV